MRTLKSTIYLAMAVGIIGCKDQKKNATTQTETQVEEVMETSKAPSITLEKLEGSPAYLNAALGMKQPASGEIKGGGETDFSFTVDNYELGAQTTGPNTEALANSGKGQHIHFILNNQPYSAHYEPDFKKELPEGVHHLVAFLSRSYHESVKNPNSVVVKKLSVGTNPEDTVGMDISAPTLIYSRPKGTYKGKDTENLLLDFFVLNTTLSEEGNKVRATINGQEFIITEWAPQIIKGLPMGEVSIDLALIDAKGDYIPGPFNKVSRTVTLSE
ncbi:hypothetical protein [Maribacter antarcticus]|uniref:hypothetical protein n=1 Tax=Maribacter antarcticus TaxID=505250 RepID=UPI0005683A8C|nr:hypothetical protein [Maribacter antarcticus]